MNFTIISAIYGNLPVVKECMDSWFPLPKNWNLIVYNSKISDLDGTTEYLKQKQAEQNFTILEDDKTRAHTSAVRQLMKHVESEWILHLDSDAKLLDKSFFDWVETTEAQRLKYKVWGRVTPRISSKIDNRKVIKGNMLYLPRCHQWLLLFEKKYMVRKNINFDDIAIEGKVRSSNSHLVSIDNVTNYDSGDDILVFGDTSWQLFWESIGDDAFKIFPDKGYNCWQHLNNKSCEWEKNNADLINKLQIRKTNKD